MPTTVPCETCGHVHPPLVDCVTQLKTAILDLLRRCGSPDTCRACKARIIWMRHANGKNTPYTEAGLNHFIDCPARDRFRRV